MLRHQLGRSTSGRRAVAQRTTNSSAALIATAPIGVSQRPSPANGMNSWPQVRSRSSWDGRTKTSAPATRAIEARNSSADEVREAWLARCTQPRASRGARILRVGDRTPDTCVCDGVAARTSPTARLIKKIVRQSATASTSAPKSGPMTLPASWTADTMPSGTARRSAG